MGVQSNKSKISALTIITTLALFVALANAFPSSTLLTNYPAGVNVTETNLARLPDMNELVELRGSVIARSNNSAITEIIFTISNTSGQESVSMTESLHNQIRIDYRDQNQSVLNLPWSHRFQGDHDDDDLLEAGELVQFTVSLLDNLASTLGPATPFVLEVSSLERTLIKIHRTTPAQLDPILDLE
jgi:hypothetical protein